MPGYLSAAVRVVLTSLTINNLCDNSLSFFLLKDMSFYHLGSDDKSWGGHYGIIMSSAVVRIKRETKIDENDGFEDISQVNVTAIMIRRLQFLCYMIIMRKY